MKWIALAALAFLLAACNSNGQFNISTIGASGCIVGGVGTYSGSCTASVASGMSHTVYLRKNR